MDYSAAIGVDRGAVRYEFQGFLAGYSTAYFASTQQFTANAWFDVGQSGQYELYAGGGVGPAFVSNGIGVVGQLGGGARLDITDNIWLDTGGRLKLRYLAADYSTSTSGSFSSTSESSYTSTFWSVEARADIGFDF